VPTYDYVCQSCGRSFEVVHGIHATRPTVCEVCGGELRKALSTPAIVFKGSGWAKKDARTASASRSSATPPTPADGSSKESPTATSDAATSGGDASKPAAESSAGDGAAPTVDRPKPPPGGAPTTGGAGSSAGSDG